MAKVIRRKRETGGGVTPTQEYLFDKFDADVSFSLRRLKSISDSVINNRRSSDNKQLNIGLNGIDLDTAKLLTHTGAGNGFNAIVFNQSNRNNFIQSFAGSQPAIVSSGAVLIDGGKPTNVFSGGQSMLTAATVELDSTDLFRLFFVINIANASATQMIYETSVTNVSNNGSFGIVIFSNTLVIQQNNAGSRVQVSVPLSTGYQLIEVALYGGQVGVNSCDVWINEALQAKTLVASATSPATYLDYVHFLGARNTNTLQFSGNIQEVIGLKGDSSSLRTTIINDIKTYYSSLP